MTEEHLQKLINKLINTCKDHNIQINVEIKTEVITISQEENKYVQSKSTTGTSEQLHVFGKLDNSRWKQQY
uniref:Uncharacterized protein n=1 Tax=Arion vulgaris TaxID=1028688 RepID=A0A0B7BGL5_9EUPU